MTLNRRKALQLAGSSTLLAMPFVQRARAEDKILNVYNWADYIGETTIEDFQKATGIAVTYDTYSSTDEMQAKMLAGSTGYDVVDMAGISLSRFVAAKIYQKIDRSKLPNWKNLDPVILNILEGFDPGIQYSMPYMWGSVGFTSGTSLSCPVAAGMVACLLQKHPSRPMMDVLRAVQQSGDRYITPDTGYGYGIANGCDADTLLSILDAVADPASALQLAVFPNPGSASVAIAASAALREVELLDAQGRVVLRAHGEGSQVQLATSGLPAGVYLARAVLVDGSVILSRWVKL